VSIASFSVTVKDQHGILATVTPSSGAWSAGLQLDEGVHELQAVSTDFAGVTSLPAAVVRVDIDAVAPSATITTPDNSLFASPLVRIAITGTAADNRAVHAVLLQYYDLRGLAAEHAATCTCDASTVSWSDTPALIPGAYTVRVVAVDEVGNRSTPADKLFVVA
jgi:hypothetical protein